MKKILFILIIVITSVWSGVLQGRTMNYSAGFHAGFIPSAGGNLHSVIQESLFDSKSGIDGINKSMDGFSTSEVRRVFGVTAGLELRAVFFDYFFARLAGNYTRGVWGGSGTTVYDAGAPTSLECTYSISYWDVPLTVGLRIPFWKDVTISFGCGAAFAYGIYTNKFKSGAGFSTRGSFTGYSFPLVLLLEGDYFITNTVSLTTSLSYYKGSTRTIRDGKRNDGTDYAKIDFTGYRFNLGVSYYFFSM